MLNFVYTIDKNFNTQVEVSIYSLLYNISEKINIFILHDNPSTLSKNIKKFNSFENCNSINIIQINTDTEFEGLENSHVTKATYYRLYIFKYLNHLPHVIYLDADTVCIRNPYQDINENIKKLIDSNYVIGSNTETTHKISPDVFQRLNMKSQNYFNAGVLLIDLNKDDNLFIFSNLIETMIFLGSKVKHWDQDVLNKYFDGKYLEISSDLNTRVSFPFDDKKGDKSTKIIHYVGSNKPWTIEWLINDPNNLFQKFYFTISENKLFFIQSKWKRNSFKLFFMNIQNIGKSNKLKLFLSLINELIKK